MVIPPDGTSTSNSTVYSYATNTATLTYPAGKARKSQLDGVGRLINVWEPDVAHQNSLTQQTSYAYDSLGRLTGVTQGVQSRSYAYDDVGRLITSTTPEAGALCLGTYSGSTCQSGYDSFGNLLRRAKPQAFCRQSRQGVEGRPWPKPETSGSKDSTRCCGLGGVLPAHRSQKECWRNSMAGSGVSYGRCCGGSGNEPVHGRKT
jgi:YD repeat-containing protein